MPSLKRKLTVRTIENVVPGDTDTFIWDTEVPGFGLRIWPSGKRVFIYQYRTKHKQTRRPVIGAYGPMRPEQARQVAREWAVAVQQGGDPGGERRAARGAPTVADLAGRYMAEHALAKKKPRSAKSDESNLRNHVVPALGHKKVAAITRADIAKLHHAMRGTPGAANRVLALLSKMFNLAERWGLRPDGTNPCRHIDRNPERKMERFLSGEEIGRLGAALAEAERTRTELPSAIAAIRLLLFTGCRLSEILTVQWDQVDYERSCLRLPESKTGAKVVYLSPPALEVLSGIERQEGNPYAITGAKPGSHLVNLRKPWHRIRERAGLADVRLHDLRHSFASMAAIGGLSLPMIGALLGHTQPQTTARYAHLLDDPVKQAMSMVGERISAALNPSETSEVVAFKHTKRQS